MTIPSRILLFTTLGTQLTAWGQMEHLVTVDPTTGVHSIIAPIPGVAWVQTVPKATALDQVNGLYIFNGADAALNKKLYAVDVLTGTVLSSPAFPQLADPNDNIVELQFDNANGTLYGLHWDASVSIEYLVSIEVSTGAFTPIAALPGVTLINVVPNYTTLDEVHGLFIFRGMDGGQVSRLYAIDVNTGAIISNPPFPLLSDLNDNVSELQADNATGTLYGLFWDGSAQQEYLATIDPATGQHTLLYEIPGARWVTSTPHYTTFDGTAGRFIFLADDEDMVQRLYDVDVQTGSITSAPSFPILEDPEDNVIELHFDDGTGTLYALHWDAHTPTGIAEDHAAPGVELHPNPFDDRTTIDLGRMYDHLTLDLLDAQGRIVRTVQARTVRSVDLCKEDLAPGVYHLRLSMDGANAYRTVVIR